jgi:hypothetical protein
VIDERLPRSEGRDRDLRRLYEVERVRFGRYLCLAGTIILGLCALPVPVVEPADSIAHGQVSDIGTERHDDTSELLARDDREKTIGTCPGLPGPRPRKFGWRDRRGMHPHQHLARSRLRPWHGLIGQLVQATMSGNTGSFHRLYHPYPPRDARCAIALLVGMRRRLREIKLVSRCRPAGRRALFSNAATVQAGSVSSERSAHRRYRCQPR